MNTATSRSRAAPFVAIACFALASCTHAPVGELLSTNEAVEGCYRVVAFQPGTDRIPSPPEHFALTSDSVIDRTPEETRQLIRELVDGDPHAVVPGFVLHKNDVPTYWRVEAGTLVIRTATTPVGLEYRLRRVKAGYAGTVTLPVDIAPCGSCWFEGETSVEIAREQCSPSSEEPR